MNRLKITVFLSALCLLATEASSQKIINHSFPRIATLQWGGGTPEWLSKFDLVITTNSDSLRIREVKRINPNAYTLATTDWNAGVAIRVAGDPNSVPAQWRTRTSTGAYFNPSGSPSNPYLLDITNFCATYNAERYNQALPRVLMQTTDWSAFDGINSDGSWTFPWGATDIDLDRNGLNDFTEPGKGPAWIKQQWETGYRTAMDTLRALYKGRWGNPNAKMIAYWSISDTMCSGVVNGVGWENAPDHGPTFTLWKPLIDQWESGGTLPRINYVCAAVRYDSVHAPARKKDYFRFMRWMLGITLLNDSYFMLDDDAGNHYYNFYYDEYDVPLGYPTGKAQMLPNGCWVRFFDGGVSIVNPTNSTQVVAGNDLANLQGYQGPYHKFRGNQDPLWNDGSLFQSVTLRSTPASWTGSTQNVGDAIILLRNPVTIVSDIIVDNAYGATSPGSPEAFQSGFSWNDMAGNAPNPVWHTGPEWDGVSMPQSWRSTYAAPGIGTASAVFRPTINISGRYNVYEWHGWRGTYQSSYTQATNVPCRVAYSNGQTTLSIDQSKNFGQWNLLGTFRFVSGGNSSVTISNNANGSVVANAFKFEYVSEVTKAVNEEYLPKTSHLSQNYPNPFNPTTTISFGLSGTAFVVLRLYDIVGRLVRTLVDKEMSGGSYQVTLDASGLASGVYVYRMQAGEFVSSMRCIVLK
jgi:hypothetical protein